MEINVVKPEDALYKFSDINSGDIFSDLAATQFCLKLTPINTGDNGVYSLQSLDDVELTVEVGNAFLASSEDYLKYVVITDTNEDGKLDEEDDGEYKANVPVYLYNAISLDDGALHYFKDNDPIIPYNSVTLEVHEGLNSSDQD